MKLATPYYCNYVHNTVQRYQRDPASLKKYAEFEERFGCPMDFNSLNSCFVIHFKRFYIVAYKSVEKKEWYSSFVFLVRHLVLYLWAQYKHEHQPFRHFCSRNNTFFLSSLSLKVIARSYRAGREINTIRNILLHPLATRDKKMPLKKGLSRNHRRMINFCLTSFTKPKEHVRARSSSRIPYLWKISSRQDLDLSSLTKEFIRYFYCKKTTRISDRSFHCFSTVKRQEPLRNMGSYALRG